MLLMIENYFLNFIIGIRKLLIFFRFCGKCAQAKSSLKGREGGPSSNFQIEMQGINTFDKSSVQPFQRSHILLCTALPFLPSLANMRRSFFLHRKVKENCVA